MVYIKDIRLQNLRIHKDKKIELSKGVNIIVGPNGSGKTTILEAIYIALQGKSFKGGDGDVLKSTNKINKYWWRVDVRLNEENKNSLRTVKYNSEKINLKKEVNIDNKISYRLLKQNKEPIVLFEPDDLRLLHGSPQRRRDFIDRFIAQINPEYSQVVKKYEKALKQRNKLLKDKNTNEIFAWDISLAGYGSQIIQQRVYYINQINNKIKQLYQETSGTKDEISVNYTHVYTGDITQKLLNELNSQKQKDLFLGVTTIGPHRHDIDFKINNHQVIKTASRGEIRTIVLALKFLEVEMIENTQNKRPIILLDDVFSELDENRQKLLTNQLKDHQIVITTASNQSFITSKTTNQITLN